MNNYPRDRPPFSRGGYFPSPRRNFLDKASPRHSSPNFRGPHISLLDLYKRPYDSRLDRFPEDIPRPSNFRREYDNFDSQLPQRHAFLERSQPDNILNRGKIPSQDEYRNPRRFEPERVIPDVNLSQEDREHHRPHNSFQIKEQISLEHLRLPPPPPPPPPESVSVNLLDDLAGPSENAQIPKSLSGISGTNCENIKSINAKLEKPFEDLEKKKPTATLIREEKINGDETISLPKVDSPLKDELEDIDEFFSQVQTEVINKRDKLLQSKNQKDIKLLPESEGLLPDLKHSDNKSAKPGNAVSNNKRDAKPTIPFLGETADNGPSENNVLLSLQRTYGDDSPSSGDSEENSSDALQTKCASEEPPSIPLVTDMPIKSRLEEAVDALIKDTSIPVVGMEFIIEYVNALNLDGSFPFHCTICNVSIARLLILEHMLSPQHHLEYLRTKNETIYNIINGLKLDENEKASKIAKAAAEVGKICGRGRVVLDFKAFPQSIEQEPVAFKRKPADLGDSASLSGEYASTSFTAVGNDLQQSFHDSQHSFHDSQQSFHDSQQSFQDTHKSFLDTHQSFQDSHKSFHDSHKSIQDSQPTFHDSQQSFHDSKQAPKIYSPKIYEGPLNFHESQQRFQHLQNFHPLQQNFQLEQLHRNVNAHPFEQTKEVLSNDTIGCKFPPSMIGHTPVASQTVEAITDIKENKDVKRSISPASDFATKKLKLEYSLPIEPEIDDAKKSMHELRSSSDISVASQTDFPEKENNQMLDSFDIEQLTQCEISSDKEEKMVMQTLGVLTKMLVRYKLRGFASDVSENLMESLHSSSPDKLNELLSALKGKTQESKTENLTSAKIIQGPNSPKLTNSEPVQIENASSSTPQKDNESKGVSNPTIKPPPMFMWPQRKSEPNPPEVANNNSTITTAQPIVVSSIQPTVSSGAQPTVSSGVQPMVPSGTQPTVSSGTQPTVANSVQPTAASWTPTYQAAFMPTIPYYQQYCYSQYGVPVVPTPLMVANQPPPPPSLQTIDAPSLAPPHGAQPPLPPPQVAPPPPPPLPTPPFHGT